MACDCGAGIAHPVEPSLVDFRDRVPGGRHQRQEDNRMNGVDDHLRHAIRQMILAGNLPKENCRMTWYGPGTGGVCVGESQLFAVERDPAS